MRHILLAAVLVLVGCSSNNGGGNGSDSGTPDSGCATCGPAWTPYDVDTSSSENQISTTPQLALAVAADDTVGMLWYEPTGTNDLGKSTYALLYRSWKAGSLSAVETVRGEVENLYGLSLTFGSDGEPIAAYLGGTNPIPPSGGGPTYWFQNDAVVSYRSQGTWTEQVVATQSNDVKVNDPVSDQGNVVGVTSAVGAAGGTTFLAYRDVHFGQFPTDFDGSDWEFGIGGPTSWSHEEILAGGGTGKPAYGGHAKLVVANGEPAAVCEQDLFPGSGPGQNVLFRMRTDAGSWVGPAQGPVISSTNLQSGPSLAFDPVLGFAVAAYDANAQTLYFTTSPDGLSQWTQPDPVVNAGSTGWYPSLAISPVTHDPSIAYYHCSPNAGVAEGNCSPSDDELRIAEEVAGHWNISTVDKNGGFLPQLGFLSSGRRVILLRDPQTGAVKLEVEN